MDKQATGRVVWGVMPAAVVGVILAAWWIWARWGYVAAAEWGGVAAGVFAGWLTAMFLVSTAAAILCAASGRTMAPTANLRAAQRGRVFLKFAMVVDGCGLLLLIVGLGTRMLGIGDVVRIYLVLAAWLSMWVHLTWLLRQVGPKFGAAGASITTAAAMLIFAAPVTAVPLVRTSSEWGKGGKAQERVVSAVGVATPLLGAFDAMKGSVSVEWAQRPEMYRLSGLGQDVPMGLPRWWVNGLVYGGIGAAAWGASRLVERRRVRREAGG